jgi:hypothetical protein
VGASIRPLREIARAVGWSILLTTHFSGAGEPKPELRLAADLSVRRTGAAEGRSEGLRPPARRLARSCFLAGLFRP